MSSPTLRKVLLLAFVCIINLPSSDARWGSRSRNQLQGKTADVLLHINDGNDNKNSNDEVMNFTSAPDDSGAGTLPLLKKDLKSASQHNNQTLRLLLYFVLWYFLTVVYNVSNKIILNELPLPFTICAVQLFLGIPVFAPIWLLKRPKVDPVAWWKRYAKIALMHGLGNLASIVSFSSGAVSFTHVIKACEPVIAALLSSMLLKTPTPLPVFASLVPIILGVGLASATELSFTWLGFASGMASNVFYQLRIVLAKGEMGKEASILAASASAVAAATTHSSPTVVVALNDGDRPDDTCQANAPAAAAPEAPMSPANMFRVLTILATVQIFPCALLFEGSTMQAAWNKAIDSGAPVDYLVSNLLISGVSYYLYNEVAFWILNLVSPTTHAVGNTIKRVVVIFASILILKTPINAQGILGSAIAMLGTLAYSLAVQGQGTGAKLGKA